MMNAQEKTIDKVMKLLAKAETTTPEEAEALVAKATELMVRAEIDEAMLAAAQGREVDEITEKQITFKGSYAEAQRDLFFAVGNGSGFRLLQIPSTGSRKVGAWVGYKRDLEQVEVLLTSLLIQQTRAATAYFKENPHPSWASAFDKFAAKRSHMMGFARGVESLLRERRSATVETVAEERAEGQSVAARPEDSVALVLRSKASRINDWMDEKYGKLRSGRARRLRGDATANVSGFSAGRSADLGSHKLGGRKELNA